MQASAAPDQNPFKQISIVLFSGILIGSLSTLLVKTLQLIEIQQLAWNSEQWPRHLLFLPVVLFLLSFIKKNTLYFPSKISELTAWKLDPALHWSPWMSFFHFFGSVLSHLVGASVGREGVVVMMAAGLVRAFRLNWTYWAPIFLGCGFSAVLGIPWIGLVFSIELFKTDSRQKIFILLSSLAAVLVAQTFQVTHLIPAVHFQDETGFFKKLFFILILGASAGYLMRFYKWAHFRLARFFASRAFYVRFIFCLLLMVALMHPDLRRYQSLGLLQLENLQSLETAFYVPFLKLTFTLFSVVLGFWGGEFIPLVYSGLHFGSSLGHWMGVSPLMGAYLTAFLLFTAASRLRWTGYFLIISLMGWTWFLWVGLLVGICLGFAGNNSLYKGTEGSIDV